MDSDKKNPMNHGDSSDSLFYKLQFFNPSIPQSFNSSILKAVQILYLEVLDISSLTQDVLLGHAYIDIG